MLVFNILFPLFGAIPLLIVLRNIRKSQKIKSRGITTDATVVQIYFLGSSFPNRRESLNLHYTVEAENKIYSGTATAGPGQYKVGDILQVAYLPEDPTQMTIKGVNLHIPVLIITILLFLFMVFATFKLGEMLNEGI